MNQNPSQQCEMSLDYRTESVESSFNSGMKILDLTITWVRFAVNILIFRTSEILMTGISLCESRFTPLADLTLNGTSTQFTHFTPRGRNGK